MSATPRPDISLIVPCRNEAAFVGPFLASIRAQDLGPYSIEILIADGISNDGTRAVLAQLAADDDRIRVVDNPEQIVSTGLNRLIGCARGDIIVRCDVHTEYASDYLRNCADTLLHTKADNVGGPWHAEGKTFLQKAIAVAFRSPFASGGARSHDPGFEGEVDSVYLGCWRRELFDRIGLYDEEMVRNQDDEHNLRIRRAGGVIWQSPKIVSTYYPRASLKALFRQYAQYGFWKVRVIQKHRVPASIRHLIPASFVVICVVLAVLAPYSHPAAYLLALLSFAYLLCSLTFSAVASAHAGSWHMLPVLPVIFFAYHFAYGYGFLRGIFEFGVLNGRTNEAFRQITRK